MNNQVIREILYKVYCLSEKIYGDKLESVILFGSYARGENTAESDIDVMVRVDLSETELGSFNDELCELMSDVVIDYDIVLNIVLQSNQTFEERLPYSTFYQNVKREGLPYAV